jgi:hypothetical protein
LAEIGLSPDEAKKLNVWAYDPETYRQSAFFRVSSPDVIAFIECEGSWGSMTSHRVACRDFRTLLNGASQTTATISWYKTHNPPRQVHGIDTPIKTETVIVRPGCVTQL